MTCPAHGIELLDLHPPAEALRDVVMRGLARRPKTLPCTLFYDQRGSTLFERICQQPEYYLTRAELAILEDHVHEMAARLGPRCAVIEFGSGSGVKSRLLLAALPDPAMYVPIDIARETLLDSSARLGEAFPELDILPVCADYTQAIELPADELSRRGVHRRVVFFPGSTIGNFHPADAERFLRRCRSLVGEGGAMLVGVDLRKDARTLEAAYNDAAGVTAEFNLNILLRLNHELEAEFDLRAFEHRAVWNAQRSRVEMHLASRRDQRVRVGGFTVWFARGEAIVTEYSYKYDLDDFAALTRRAGWRVRRVWTDEQRLFSVHELAA